MVVPSMDEQHSAKTCPKTYPKTSLDAPVDKMGSTAQATAQATAKGSLLLTDEKIRLFLHTVRERS